MPLALFRFIQPSLNRTPFL